MEKLLRQIHDELAIFNDAMDMAIAWMGVVPALPGNEIRQVQDHWFTICMAVLHGDIETVSKEYARILKHVNLATFDTLTTLNHFHVEAIELALKAFKKTNATFVAKVLKDLKVIRKKLDELSKTRIPSEPKPEFEDTVSDTNEIRKLVQQQFRIAQDLESLYRAPENAAWTKLAIEMMQKITTSWPR